MRLMGVRIYAILLALIGAVLTWGGVQLALLGGSPYYVLAGVGVLASGILVLFRRHEGVALYALVLVATICWALWEAGFDGWALLPRVGGPLILGLILFTPWCTRMLTGRGELKAAILVAALVIAFGMGASLHALRPAGVSDPIYQTGTTMPRPDKPVGPDEASRDWPVFGQNSGGSRFSGLTQITPTNVAKLEVAWTYKVGVDAKGRRARLSVTPLKIGQSLYLCTAWNDVVALDADTGKEQWRARSGSETDPYGTCRGVAYYRVPDAAGLCATRIITNTVDARLIAVDANTGKRCPGFGKNGEVSLLTGMGPVDKSYYTVTSPPTIVRGRIVVGGFVFDGQYWGEPSGVIRGYDAITGKFSWAFDVGRLDRQTEPPPGESYTRSTPNSWAPMSADEKLGLVYAPTGNATPDYYGGLRRPFDDEYSSSTVAIDAETGKLRWSFQTTHHDLWDYDVASQPTLLDLPGPNGGIRRALVQPTKRGELFVLDRETGKPITKVEERRVPTHGHVKGERISPTQPFSIGMPSLAGPVLTEESMWGISPLDQLWCRIRFRQARYDGPMTPPGLTPSIEYPGYAGGSNWGSVAIDTDRNILVANANRMSMYVKLMPRAEADRRGVAPYSEKNAVDIGGTVAQARTPYAAVIAPFFSPLAIPCQAPPFGTMSGIDLATGKLLWTRRLGTANATGPLGIPSHLPLTIGTTSFGGPMTTRSGLTFIAATQDGHFRAFETRTGNLLWNVKLPAGGHSIPMTYESSKSKRQFVIVAVSGNQLLGSPTGNGDYIVAYSLP